MYNTILCVEVMTIFIIFASLHFCEIESSVLEFIKHNYRNLEDAEHPICLRLDTVE